MKPTLIVLMNEDTNKTIGVFLHDVESGRVLLKVRPSDQSLMQTFNLWRNKPIIEQIRQEIRGRKLTRRIRILPTDLDYGKLLVDRFVKSPYRVRFSNIVDADSLDTFLDSSFINLVDTVKSPTPAVSTYINPFITR